MRQAISTERFQIHCIPNDYILKYLTFRKREPVDLFEISRVALIRCMFKILFKYLKGTYWTSAKLVSLNTENLSIETVF